MEKKLTFSILVIIVNNFIKKKKKGKRGKKVRSQ